MKIGIYGVGLEGEKFNCRYCKQYEIIFAIDKNYNRKFHDVFVYSFEKLKMNLARNKLRNLEMGGVSHIVITTEQYYSEIKDKLRQFTIFEPFQSKTECGFLTISPVHGLF